jgi:hypothetical protein
MIDMPITNYIILTARKQFDLESSVRFHIKNRWIPQGGIAVDGHDHFYQAMIKYQCLHYSVESSEGWICNKCGEKV